MTSDFAKFVALIDRVLMKEEVVCPQTMAA